MSTTALAYWKELAYALDDGAVYTVASATSTTVTAIMANTASDASENRYDGRWLAVVSGSGAGQQRAVAEGQYTPSTGAVTLNVGWNTVPTGGDLVMLTGLFPVFNGGLGEDTSYLTLANRALAMILVPDRVDLSVTDDSTSLAAYPWLDREGRLDTSDGEGWLLDPSPVSGRRSRPCMWRGPKLVLNAQTPTLELKAPLTGVVTMKVRRPGNTYIGTASSWGETAPSSGLVNASDEAIPTIEEVVTVGKMLAYQALMGRSPGRPSGNWADKYADAREQAMKLARFDHTLYAAAAAEGAA